MGKQVANVSPEDTQILNNIQKRISLESQLANKVDWSNYIKSHNSASESMKGFLTNTDYAEKSLANYQVYLEKTGNTTSKFSSFTSKAGSLLKSFGAGLANMGMGMLAGLAIDGVITILDNIINHQDKLIQKGEEAKSAIDDTMSSFTDSKTSLDNLGKSFASNADNIKNTGDAIGSIANKYVELSNGVNKLNNENKSLSGDEYQSYLDISNKLADQFPSLVSGYDAQGNAILNLGSNADSAAVSLQNLYDTQMLSAHVDVGENIDDVYDGVMAQIDKYESNNTDIQNAIKEYEKSLRYAEEQNDTDRVEALTRYINDYKQQITANNQAIKDQYAELAKYAQQYLSTSSEFGNIDSELQSAIFNNLQNADYSLVGDKYGGDFKQFLNAELITPLTSLQPEMQQTFSDLLTMDTDNLSINEYKSAISNALKQSFPDDTEMQDQMKSLFGFDQVTEDAETQLKRLQKDFGHAVDDMSLSELNTAFDLVVNGDESIETVDELKDKIQQAKELAATSVDLDVHTNMDAIATALESANAGADYENAITYLEKAKDLFDKGLVGTDDFKSIAAYLSPTGSDDPVNFAENYSKAARYLTEDGQGVQNFLKDLESKGMASMETLSDGTQQWTYDIKDLEQAASDMGIGFEFMMDMFGRLEDYGFHNNFVGSVEDGTQRIADLATELAQEEAKLAQLQAEGADTTAIEQQQAKVNALKNDINETSAAMEQLISKSASDYNQEINAAKQTIESLQKEYQNLQDNPDLYGDNTELVAEKLEEQIRSIAGEYGIELDADLNIKQPDTVPTITVDSIFNKADLDSQLANLASGQKIKFGAELDGTFSDITALMNENGTVTFSANIDGVEQQVALVKDENGTITFTADTAAVDEETQKTDGGERVTSYTPDTSQIDVVNAVTDGGERAVEYFANTVNLPNYFPAITRTVNYVASGVGAAALALESATGKASGTMLAPARVSGTAYNVLNLKPAYAGGSVALPRDEKALVNEISQESIIRDGKWSLIPGGMHIESLKKGDIVLNASQTKALLQYGKAPGHARAYAQGSLLSAYAGGSGGGGFFTGGSGGYSGMTGSYNNNTTNAAKAVENAADSVSEAADEFKEKFDEIEILLDRMDRSLNKLTDSIETYSYDLSKQSFVSDQAMNQIRSNLTTLQQAYNRYIQEANSVGLDESWASKVRDGSINVETVTDESLMDKIKDYENWYNKALDVQDTIADYQSQLLDLATEKLDNIEQYFENRTNYNDEFGYLTDVSTLQEALDKLTAELDKQVASGVIKEGSNEFYEAMSKIAEMQQKLIEATLKKYQDIIDNLDRISITLDNSIALKEARGETITEEDYQRPLEVANEQIDELYKKREQLLKQQAIYDVGSELYDDYADQIADVDDEIYGLLGDIEDLKDKIWEVRWQPFFDGMEAAENLRNEMDEFRSKLSEDSLISETGGLTENGITSIALISAAMNSAKQQIKDYSTALEKLEQDLEAGNISTSEFEEQQLEFLQAIRDSSGEVADYQNTLIDMYTTMLERENDVMQDSISKQKELLDWRKKNADYAKSIRNQTKEINQIQAQINALSGSTNQSSIAERKRLEAQLAELQEELQSSQEDRAYDIRSQGYDSLSDDLNNALNDSLNEITYNADKQEEIISNMLNNVLNNYKDVYSKINQIIANTGIVPSDQFQQVIDNLDSQSGAESQVNDSNTIAPDYNPSDFTNVNTGQIQSGSNQNHNDFIESEIKKEPNIDNRPVAQIALKPKSISIEEGKSATISANIRPTDAANKSVKWSSSNIAIATVSNGVVKGIKPGSTQITCAALDGSGVSATATVVVTKKPDPPKPQPPASSGGDGIPRVGDVVTFTGSYYYDSWGQNPAGNLYSGIAGGVVIDAYSASKYGGGASFTGGYDVHIKSADGRYGDLGWVSLNQISGYATGTKGITKPVEIARIDEMGKELRIKRGGDIYEMFRYGDAVVPKHMTDNLFTLADHTNEVMETINGVDRNGGEITINNNYDSLLHVDGNVDKDALPGLQELLYKSYQYTSKQMKRDATLQGIRRTL